MGRPLIGITADVGPHARSGRATCSVSLAYAECVARAGGVPVVLAPIVEMVEEHMGRCDGFVLTGGDDPRMEEFGAATHPKASVMDPRRQAYEVALLRALEKERPGAPVLGICLGMQLMALVSGGAMNQHLPETHATHADHSGKEHVVVAARGVRAYGAELEGMVASHHRQAVSDPGRLEVLATAHDGVIEAVGDPTRKFCVGVQWHPERTGAENLGLGVFRALVGAAR